MFDFSFGEMLLTGVVALVVLGPERLPKVARTAGQLMSKLQRYVSDVKAEISREVELEELKNIQANLYESARGIETEFKNQVSQVEASVHSAEQGFRQMGESMARAAETATQADLPPTPAVEGMGAPTISGPVLPANSMPPGLAAVVDPPAHTILNNFRGPMGSLTESATGPSPLADPTPDPGAATVDAPETPAGPSPQLAFDLDLPTSTAGQALHAPDAAKGDAQTTASR